MATEKHCERALDQHEEKLSLLPGVVGLGIVSTGEADPGGDEDVSRASLPDDLAVAVYVEKKLPPEEVAEDDRIPETLEIPGVDGPRQVPIRVIEQGPISLEEFEIE